MEFNNEQADVEVLEILADSVKTPSRVVTRINHNGNGISEVQVQNYGCGFDPGHAGRYLVDRTKGQIVKYVIILLHTKRIRLR